VITGEEENKQSEENDELKNEKMGQIGLKSRSIWWSRWNTEIESGRIRWFADWVELWRWFLCKWVDLWEMWRLGNCEKLQRWNDWRAFDSSDGL